MDSSSAFNNSGHGYSVCASRQKQTGVGKCTTVYSLGGGNRDLNLAEVGKYPGDMKRIDG